MRSIEPTRKETELIQLLHQILPAESIRSRLIDRISFAADAGFYHLIPIAILQPATEAEIEKIFRFSQQHKIPVTFRTGGTSLSGQAVTDGLLVDLSKYWLKIALVNDGNSVLVQPGAIGAVVNNRLKAFARKIGPDPASISSAMMGGIISNNASGMCCGVAQNSYHTLKHIRFMLPNGRVYDTRISGEEEKFEKECPELATVLKTRKQQIMADEKLLHTIRHKYQIKNTVGYALNAFVDYGTPLSIFAHLLVGAEGTLAFISEAELETVPDYPFKATGLLFFDDIFAACKAIQPFSELGARAIELMDRSALRSVEHIAGIPAIIQTLPPSAAALLIEFQGESEMDVATQLIKVPYLFPHLALLEQPVFSQDPAVQALYWKVRKGLFPSVGAVRASGTTVILEDVAVPVAHLGNAISDLQGLFLQYGYPNAIIFGHARDGNIHFVVTQAFDTEKEIERYDRFIRDVVNIIVNKYNGSLKAEHGTGRNMAPFVKTEWGGDLYQIMKEIKGYADPNNLLNPGVIINEHADAHIRHLKKLPTVESEVDTCIECGFCEHKCPSRHLTLTPRKRIVVRRALKSLQHEGEGKLHKELLQQYQYDGLDTCAVDGLCATACPVDIDTGKLVKRLRSEKHSAFGNGVAKWIARNFSFILSLVKFALRTGNFLNRIFGKKFMFRFTKMIRKIIPAFPLWSNHLHAAPSIKKLQRLHKDKSPHSIVYIPACINRLMGEAKSSQHVSKHFSEVALKSGIELYIPADIAGSCCGQIFSSKGYKGAYNFKVNQFIEKLWTWSGEGERPVVIDFSSCVYTVLQSPGTLTDENRERLKNMQILETVQFIKYHILPIAPTIEKKKEIVVHPVCSMEKMNMQSILADVAGDFAEEVVIPANAGCCGMAGDRGFLFPELTASASAAEAAEVQEANGEGHYSTSKTCEIALSDASGKEYQNIIRLANECIKPPSRSK